MPYHKYPSHSFTRACNNSKHHNREGGILHGRMSIMNALDSEIPTGSWIEKLGLSFSILFLFLCLYTVNSRYSVVSLCQIVKILGIPADLAGMTLLAFGNGAPDFFTAVFGISQAPEMILSGAVGAALFTFTIVFGLVLILQKKQPPVQVANLNNELALLYKDGQEEGQLTRIPPFPFFRNVLLCIFCSSSLLFFLLIAVHIIKLTTTPSPSSSEPLITIGEKLSDGCIGSESSWPFWSLSFWEKLIFLWKNSCWRRKDSSWISSVCNFIIQIPLLVTRVVFSLSILATEYPETAGPFTDKDISTLVTNRLKLLIVPWTSMFLLGLVISSFKLITWVLLGVVAVILCIILWVGSYWSRKPRFFILHAIYAFTTCLGFIYIISRELISCLRSLGGAVGISPSTMGIIVLAWGNSFGDLMANTTMSHNGFVSIAIFAVFSAHIQNVLFTLGTAFLIATLNTHSKSIIISDIDFKVFLGLGIVATVLVLSLSLIPTLTNFTIPKWCGFILLLFYVTFTCIVVFLEFKTLL